MQKFLIPFAAFSAILHLSEATHVMLEESDISELDLQGDRISFRFASVRMTATKEDNPTVEIRYPEDGQPYAIVVVTQPMVTTFTIRPLSGSLSKRNSMATDLIYASADV